MSTNEVRSNDAARNAAVAGIDINLEVVVIPVSDVERSKEFYGRIGWRLDIDRSAGEDFRLVQHATGLLLLSPFRQERHVGRSRFSQGIPDRYRHRGRQGPPGRRRRRGRRVLPRRPGRPGQRPASRASFRRSRALFSDPDDNGWHLQEITTWDPLRVESGATFFRSASDLASALRRAEAAHGEHEKRIGQRDANWPDWYAAYMVAEQSGKE